MFPAQSPWLRAYGDVIFIVNVMMVAIRMRCGVLVSKVKILQSLVTTQLCYSKIPASLSMPSSKETGSAHNLMT